MVFLVTLGHYISAHIDLGQRYADCYKMSQYIIIKKNCSIATHTHTHTHTHTYIYIYQQIIKQKQVVQVNVMKITFLNH